MKSDQLLIHGATMKRWAYIFLVFLVSETSWGFEELDITTGKPTIKPTNPVENDEHTVVGVNPNEEPPADPSRTSSFFSSKKSSSAASSGYRFSPENDFHARLGIILNQKDLNGLVGAHGAFNRYSGMGLDFAFKSRYYDKMRYTNYASEILFRGQVPNPSLFTPYIYGGPGYESWRLTDSGNTVDRSGSFTVVYGAGLEIALSRYFGMVVQSKTTRYENPAPKFRDNKLINSKDRIQDSVEVMFQYVI